MSVIVGECSVSGSISESSDKKTADVLDSDSQDLQAIGYVCTVSLFIYKRRIVEMFRQHKE